jgi:solute:Na+ symporter, SSS family
LLAGIISAIGYLGFTSSQMLAGAKLASATFVDLDLMTALFVMGVIAVVYTVMGGLKAVIYTDTVQWIILMAGLIFIGIPMGYHAIGGYDAIVQTLPPEFLRWDNLTWQMLVNWAVTIIPIWFVGMTLYQRIYACKGPKEAQKAWFIAGLFEWPIMAIMGVVLGLFARVAAEQGMFDALGYAGVGTMDEEIGLPLLLRDILPVGLLGLMMSAYFSAILSTADSCLMAASGNIVTDILGVKSTSEATSKATLRMSQLITLGVGVAALILASTMENVLELMLYSYAFLVSGLLVPLVAALFGARVSSTAAFWSMLVGGATTVGLSIAPIDLPLQLDPNVFGISASAITFVLLNSVTTKKIYAHDKL